MNVSACSIVWPGSVLTLALALVAGCSAPAVSPQITSDVTAEKVPALIEQSDRGEAADYRALVQSLDDDDPAVRLFAAQSLEELTGQTFGYRYYQTRDERRPAVDRWRDWLEHPDRAQALAAEARDAQASTGDHAAASPAAELAEADQHQSTNTPEPRDEP